MAQINNNEVLLKLVREAKIQTSIDQVPSQLARAIVPVLNVNPERMIQTKSGAASDSAGAAVYTTDAIKETFIVGVSLSVAKDVNATSILSGITAIPFGSSAENLIIIRYEPTTAGQFIESIMFPIPIKLDKSSIINVTNSTAVGSIDASAIIYFYEVETESG